jgi:hypothetical protein
MILLPVRIVAVVTALSGLRVARECKSGIVFRLDW